MRELGIDIETYSSNDLAACGVYKYVEAPDFSILLFGYCVDGGPVICCDFAQGETLPGEIMAALRDAEVVKTAYNAAFERVCISKYFGWPLLDPAQWVCTMVRAARMGLPLSLSQCGEVLKLENGKMTEGKALIRLFSMPQNRAAKSCRVMPADQPEKWATFKKYNVRDVEVEQAILSKVRRYEAPEFDNRLYVADQKINDRGVEIDRQLVTNAAYFDAEYKAQLAEEAKRITGMENPNSPSQIKQYLTERTGVSISTLNKKSLDDVLDLAKDDPAAVRLLELRREMAKTSNKKYEAMLDCVCSDGRIHGLLQFYGANRTGRWAGRLVQVQNLPQNHLADLDYARYLVKHGSLEEFAQNYSNPTQVLSELIRTAFIAKKGSIYHVCDFSAIEARVIAWLAGESWVLDVFQNGGDIYCATASQMFNVPVEKHGQNAALRQKGKIAVLALGYGGGVGALENMGGSRMGLTETEEKEIMRRWRDANPKIVRFWQIIQNAALRAITTGESSTINRGIVVAQQWGALTVTLPSGRVIVYMRARVEEEVNDGARGDHDVIVYEGLNQTTKKWQKIRTYGGKLTENIVQAIARDILGIVILRAEDSGYKIVFHIHDEIIVEAEAGQTLAEIESLFSNPIEWCKDLPLNGAGYSTPYYLKD